MKVEWQHPIQVVARRTGLTPHVIRVWEKRYGAVLPQRTATNRRLYSEADITRFRLLRRVIEMGWSIGQAARLPTEELFALVDETAVGQPQPSTERSVNGAAVRPHLEACMAAIERLDVAALEDALLRAATALGKLALIEQVIVPLMHQIGELWREGTLRAVHEHLAFTTIRTFLSTLRTSGEAPASVPATPHLMVTTPAGQNHELGALIVAAVAATEGWGVTYLGANLPAEEIAAAAAQLQVKAVVLSITYPPDDPHLESELYRLRRSLPQGLPLLVGGRAAAGYSNALQTIGAVRLRDITSLRVILEALRSERS